jgi:hypothetical protein
MATRFSLMGDMIPRSVRRSFEQRSEPRIEPDSDHAVFEYRGRRHRVHLVNISVSGAMIEFETTPHIGERVALEVLGAPRLEGFVRWAKGGRLGLNFN